MRPTCLPAAVAMVRALARLLSLSLAFALSACGGGGGPARAAPSPAAGSAPAAARSATPRSATVTTTVTAPASAADLHLTGATLPPGVIYDRRATAALRARAETYLVGGWRDPVNAVRAFAFVYGNWTASTVALHMRMLSYITVGQARSLVTLQAAQTAGDGDLQRGGISNAATIEAIAPLPGSVGRYLVVTREQTSSSRTGAYQGLPAGWHVSLATVAPVPEGLWVVSGWQAES